MCNPSDPPGYIKSESVFTRRRHFRHSQVSEPDYRTSHRWIVSVNTFNMLRAFSKGLKAFIIIIIIIIILHSTDAQKASFQLRVPDQPVLAQAGHDILLSASLLPEMSARGMEIRWFKGSFSEFVCLWKDGTATQGPGYQGRVEINAQGLDKGNVSLWIRGVQVRDDGEYKCHVSDDSWYEEPAVRLRVTSQGSTPRIMILKRDRHTMTLGCGSDNWFPKPSLLWTDGGNGNLTGKTEEPKQMSGGFYHISSQVTISTIRPSMVECGVAESLQKVELHSRVQFSDEFFSSTQPVRTYVSGVVIPCAVALICIIGAVLYARKSNQECTDKLKDLHEVQEKLSKTEKVNDDQAKQLVAVKSTPESVWNLIRCCKADVTLDPDTANKYLTVSEDGKSVKVLERQNLPPKETRFKDQINLSVLAEEGFRSGCHYWEVSVMEKKHWSVGVAIKSVTQKDRPQFIPESGFWVLRLHDNKLFITQHDANEKHLLPDALKPQTVGVFVDCEGHQVSFYNVQQKCHIYTFSNCNREELFPFLSTMPQCKHPFIISPVDRTYAQQHTEVAKQEGEGETAQTTPESEVEATPHTAAAEAKQKGLLGKILKKKPKQAKERRPTDKQPRPSDDEPTGGSKAVEEDTFKLLSPPAPPQP